MDISSISNATPAYNTPTASSAANLAGSVAATQTQNLQVQDEIILSVIQQAQDQQQVMADGLVSMMQGLIDIYA